MKTAHHLHIRIDDLLELQDLEIFMHCQPHPAGPSGIRAELTKLKAAGQEYFVQGRCNNQTADGRCAGHAVSNPAAKENLRSAPRMMDRRLQQEVQSCL